MPMSANMAPLLVAWDDSAPSRRAFDYALDLARLRAQALRVISVIELPEVYGGVGMGEVDPERIATMRQTLDKLCASAKAAGVECSGEVLLGAPAELLIDALRGSNAAALVMGHTEKNLLMRWLLGSVSRTVLDEAKVPVTLVP
jgi:nucleotide-binding universal stress UspA family protein